MTEPDDTDDLLDAVSAAVLAVTRHLSVAEVLEVIVRSARRLLGARYGALGIPDDEGGFAEFIADGVPERQRAAIGPLPRQHGMLAALLRGGETIRVSDIREDPRFGWWPKAHPVLTAFLGVPIRDGGDVIGIVFLADRVDGADFSDRDERVLTLFAAHAAIALTNARLYERNLELSVVEERNRLARDLHDVVAQQLFSLRLTARSAAATLPVDPEAAAGHLAEVERMAAEAGAALRSVIVELRPADLEAHGLAETLRRFTVTVGRVHRLATEFHWEGEIPLDKAGELEMLRMTQEAVYNAVRHARPRTVAVVVRGGETVVVEVSDDGDGFDPSAGSPRGLGMASMRERAHRLSGTVEFLANDDGGTTVRMEVPA